MIREDNPNGCILEVDLEYPEKMHNLHNDHFLVPEKIESKQSMLSNYYFKEIANKCNISVAKVKKFVQ